jgi:sigma-B regulation protein RsbU (phosphoserine phosphatase)
MQTETVLVVEDSQSEQFRMSAMLQGFGYRVATAENGRQALEILRGEAIRLIVSDWRMPAMTGIDLCRALRDDPTLGQPYVILVTGQNTKTDLVAGMDAGADDFIAKPFSSEELRVRLQAGARILGLRRESEQRSRQLADALSREAEANQTMRRDLALAARMQREFLPAPVSPFPQISIATLFHAASMVAGDGYNFFRLDEQHLGFFLIDVAGHGVAAAMLSFAVSRLLSPEHDTSPLGVIAKGGPHQASGWLPRHIVPPDRVLHWLNQHFVETDDCTHYLTMVYGVLNVETGAGELCQAGHPHPLIVENQHRVKKLGKGGFPVGMLAEATYEPTPFHLGVGERLVLYSDGITESRGGDGSTFGIQRLANLLGQIHGLELSEGIAQTRTQLLQGWLSGAPGEDDISLLAIERRRPAAR